MKTYDWQTQLAIGEHYEAVLDMYFGRYFEISAVDMDLQKLGIDRIHYHPVLDNFWPVEYKTDTKAQITGNVYIELQSGNKPGWMYTTQAQSIIYYTLPSTIYVFEPETVLEVLDEWKEKYRTVEVKNKGYSGFGVLVPVNVLEEYGYKIALPYKFVEREMFMEKYPELSMSGLVRLRTFDDDEFEMQRSSLRDANIELCVNWIQENTVKTDYCRTDCTSYNWKHLAEKDIGYTSNGVFILSALLAGYRITENGFSPHLNMKLSTDAKKAYKKRYGLRSVL